MDDDMVLKGEFRALEERVERLETRTWPSPMAQLEVLVGRVSRMENRLRDRVVIRELREELESLREWKATAVRAAVAMGKQFERIDALGAELAEAKRQLSDIACTLNNRTERVWFKCGRGTLAEQVAAMAKLADANAQAAQVLERARELEASDTLWTPEERAEWGKLMSKLMRRG